MRSAPMSFLAVPGYDLCTGWGTPAGSNLINALAEPLALPILAVQTNILAEGNGNGVVDFDECNNLTIVVTNEGKATATHVQGVLVSDSFPAVTIGQGAISFPDILPRSSAIGNGVFTINTQPTFVCGTPVNLTLILKSDQVVQTNHFQLPSGILAPPIGFTNNTTITIPNQNFNAGTNSPIMVDGITSVGKITVSCFISTPLDEGLTIQLMSPTGQTITLASDLGFGADFGQNCAPASSETVFDDGAPTAISLGSPPFVGSFAPQQPLSTFNFLTGTNVNGIWNLVVLDELPTLPAQLNCWSLNISPYLCQDGGGQCPGADLGLTMTAGPNPVLASSNLVYVLSVTNGGPSSASGVVVNQTLDPTVAFIAATNLSQGNVSAGGSTITWDVGTMGVGSNATASVVVVPTQAKTIISTANVGYPGSDPNPANNTASVSVLATVPSVDVGVTMIASPNPAPVGCLLTYVISVTNNGPYIAFGVTLTNNLPPNVNVISVTTSQGTYGPGGNIVSLGTLPPGTDATVTIVASPTTTGTILASSQVFISPSETDPVAANNLATSTVTVVPAADLAVSAIATPSPVISGSNFSYVLTFTNLGSSGATAVLARQTLPGNVSLVSSSFPLATNAGGFLGGTSAILPAERRSRLPI